MCGACYWGGQASQKLETRRVSEEPKIKPRVSIPLGDKKRSWARQSSGALPCRIPKPGGSCYGLP